MGIRARIALAMGCVALLPLILVGWTWRGQVEHLRIARVAAEARATGRVLEQWRDEQHSLHTLLSEWRRFLEEDKDLSRWLAGEHLSNRRRAKAMARAAENAERLGFEVASLARGTEERVLGSSTPIATSFAEWKSLTGDHQSAWFWHEQSRSLALLAQTTWAKGASPRRLAAVKSWPASAVSQRLSTLAQVNVDVFPLSSDEETPSSGQAGLSEIPLSGPSGRPAAVLRADLRGLGYEDVAHVHRVLSAIALLAVLLTLLLSWLLASRLSLPLRRLTRAVQEVADGRREAVVMPGGPGAVGKLAAALDRSFHSLRRAERERGRAERLAAWTEVAQRLTHEVRNPLTPARLAIENMQRARNRGIDALDAVFAEESAVVLTEIQRLERLVREFADYARLPRAQMREADLAPILRGAVSGQVKDHPKISVAFDFEAEPVMRAVDIDLFTGAVANLARNAVEAIADAEGRLLVTMKSRRSESAIDASTGGPVDGATECKVEIVIEDDGPGIPDALVDTLFDPYVTGRREGTGLGLSIVRRIIEEHGGTIEAENKTEGGARFCIRLA